MQWKPRWGWSVGLGMLLVAGLAGFGCRAIGTEASAEEEGSRGGTLSKTGAPPMEVSGVQEDGMRVVKVRARKFEFVPARIVVNQGDKVRLDVTSDDVTHGIAMGHFKIDQVIEPGKTVSVTFTADEAGTFGFHCSVFCGMGHMKMRGDVVVLPAAKP